MKLIKKKKRKKYISCVELEIGGANLERTLNFLCSKNIDFFEVEKISTTSAKIQTRKKYLKQITKFLEEKNVKIKDVRYLGFEKFKQNLHFRYGILIGLFLCLSLLVVSSNFVLNIDVLGLETLNENEIIAVLNKNGINKFCFLNTISTKQVENLILENFNSVSMVSAIKKGTTILINLKEKNLNDDLKDFSPLVAECDGMITDLKLIQGTPLVKIGDIVRKGDVLVAPYIINSKGEKVDIKAKAEIFADCWFSSTETFNEVSQEKQRTGNFVSFRRTSIKGQTLFSNISDIPFKEYDSEIKTVYLSDAILPIKYEEIFYFETKYVIIERKFDDFKENLIATAKQNALKLAKNKEIKNEDLQINSFNGKFIITYLITVNQSIC